MRSAFAFVSALALLASTALYRDVPPGPPEAMAQSVRGDDEVRTQLGQAYGALPLSFEANRGQSDPQVDFVARGSGYTLFLTSTEAVFSLRGTGRPRLARA